MLNIMKTKTNILLIIATLFILLFFAACKLPSPGGCPNPPETITLNVQGYTKSLIPYKDYDTIRFLKDKNDTVLFIGGKVQTNYVQGATQEDCPSIKLLQQMFQTFYDSVFKNNLTLRLFVPNIQGETSTAFEIIYNNGLFGNTDAMDFFCDTTQHHTAKGITVLGKSYCATEWSITNVTIFYADYYGIVKIIWLNSVYEKIP